MPPAQDLVHPLRDLLLAPRDDMRPLTDAIEPSPLREGLEVATWRDDLNEAVREAHNEAFRDHWGSEPASRDQWQFRFARSDRFLPTMSFLALEGRGLRHVQRDGADRVAPGGPQAWLATIGVRRDHRKSGVASALMTRTMKAFREHGFRTAVLDVDTGTRPAPWACTSGTASAPCGASSSTASPCAMAGNPRFRPLLLVVVLRPHHGH